MVLPFLSVSAFARITTSYGEDVVKMKKATTPAGDGLLNRCDLSGLHHPAWLDRPRPIRARRPSSRPTNKGT
jgi:hypothetical protein